MAGLRSGTGDDRASDRHRGGALPARRRAGRVASAGVPRRPSSPSSLAAGRAAARALAARGGRRGGHDPPLLERTGAPGDHHAAGRWEQMLHRAAWSVAGSWWMSDQLRRPRTSTPPWRRPPVLTEAADSRFLSLRPWWRISTFRTSLRRGGGLKRAAATEAQRRLAHRALSLRLTRGLRGVSRGPRPAVDGRRTIPSRGAVLVDRRRDGSAVLAAPTTAKEAAKVVLASEEAWWRFELPAPAEIPVQR